MNQGISNDHPPQPGTAVAIIGMSGRFPGAPDARTFWSNVRNGVESLRRQNLDTLARIPPELRERGEYVPVRGILDDVDRFDAAFFGISPREAEAMDPQQRIFLECCWHALEDAGRVRERSSLATGVFAGQSLNTYLLNNLCRDRAFIERITAAYQTGEFPVLFGNDPAFLATRVAHKLDLRGPAITVQTACSTSLVAVAQAVQSLLAFQCDLCLAGGVSISFPQERGHLFLEGSMVSPDGHCRPFDAEAAGTVFGSGGGAVVLRRLEDAVAAGDRIYAVIRGAAVNNDGADKPSYSAPGIAGQREAIATALALADVEPGTIGYVEAHGTGTPLGDPIEFEALAQAFRAAGESGGATGKQFCALGSLKANIGHLEAAAGIAGLIKAALAVHDGVLPPTLHFKQANPRIDLANSPFFVSAERKEWPAADHPRRAGISSFGVGGTNAHIVIEQAPAAARVEPPAPDDPGNRPLVFTFSGRTPDAARRAAAALAAHLEAEPRLDLADAASTLAHARENFAHRLAVAGRSRDQLIAALRAAADSPRAALCDLRHPSPPVVFLFPGQGAQRPGMLRDLYRAEALVRALVDHAAALVAGHAGRDARELLLADPDDQEAADALQQTRLTQPCIFITELAIARLWQSWGVQPAALIGHSVGEYVAACLAGIMSVEDALNAVARRGALAQEQPAGSMLAVRMSEAALAGLVPEGCSIAAVNAPELCVVAGPDARISELESRLEKDGRPGRRLLTSHAFHSPMMDPVVPALEETMAGIFLKKPALPIVSTVSGQLLTEHEARDPRYWAKHARATVRFADALTTLMERFPGILLEVGPGKTLTQLARQHPAAAGATEVIASLPLSGDTADGALDIAGAAGRLWMNGVPIDWRKRDENRARRIVSLPGYAFADTRYWVEPPQLSPRGPETNTEATGSVRSADDTEAVTPEASRLPRLVREVLAVLEEISGHPMADVAPDSSLLDLGFDSLLLAQVSTSIRDRFGVSVTFRQLMEQFSTPASIAARLDAEMPAAPEAKGEGQDSSAVSAVESLVQQQLDLMRKQLEVLGGASSPSPLAEVLRAQLESREPRAAQDPGVAADVRRLERHGPFRPVEKSKGDTLTDTQRQHLDELIAAYCERTAASKRYAEEHRAEFCDPRSISGFHPLWKEMVYPIVCERSRGPRLWDPDGNEYLDLTMGFGVNFFGHTPDFVSRAIADQMERGYEIGPQTPLAGKVAQLLCELTGMERATVCNTGSEAVMAAMRVARAVTGRSRIVIFSGDYHGMFDSVLVRGARRNGEPNTLPIAPGIPRGLIEDITVLDYGAEESLEWIRNHGREIAAVIVEPVQSRNPALQPREFLHRLRALTSDCETALVFDEVITGFRCHPGGAQAWYSVRADMATYGKVIGGGMPIGALAGARKWMDALDGGHWSYGDDSIPEVGVTFFAGTFVRHPLAMAAAFAALSYLKAHGPELQESVNRRAARLADELNDVFREFAVVGAVDHFASIFRVELSSEYRHAGLFFFHLRLRGIHFWEGRVGFISTTHTDADIDRIVSIFREAVAAMQAGGFLPAIARDETPATPPALTAPPVARDAVEQAAGKLVPLTEEQHEIWLACQLGDATSTNFNMSAALHFAGAVDEAALTRAIQQVIDRHEALRSVFLEDGSAQLIKPAVPAQIEMFHLPDDPAERDARLRAEMARPFDLARGPLTRFLLSMRSDGATLVFTAHHSCCDGWSYDTILREMAACYNARVRGSGPAALEPATQISTFAAEAPRRRVSPENIAAQSFWRKTLENMPSPPDLPEDFARPQKARFNAGHERRVIPPAKVKAIKDFARDHRATLFSTLFASYGALAHRLSGSDDMLIGVPVAGQHVHDARSLVAHCVHFLPMRQRIDAAASFAEHTRATSAMLFEAFEHSRVSFGELLRELNWRRDPSRPSPLGITFNLDPPATRIEFEGLEMELKPTSASTLNAELCFNAHEEADGSLSVECDYCSDLFSAETIRRWLEHFETLLDAATREPARAVAELPLVPPEQLATLLVTSRGQEANGAGERARGARLLHELFEERAAARVGAPAVADARKSLTYGGLDARANQLARHLIGKGARSGECVALLFERSVDFIVAVLGALKSGAAFVPLDAAWPEERKTAVIKSSGVRILVTAGLPPPAGAGNSLTIVDTLTDAAEIDRQPYSKADVAIRPDQLAYIIFTSGSTGTPKGVMIEHRSIAAHIESIARVYQLSGDDRGLLFHSTAFDPTIEQMFAAFHAGASLHARGDELWTGQEFAEKVKSLGLTVVDLPPRYWQQVLQEIQTFSAMPDLGKLRLVIVGGETLSPWATRLWRACGLTRIRLVNSYGPTECSVTATTHDVPREPCERELAGRVPIGRPHGPVVACVLGPDLRPAPIGVKGELCIGGPTVGRGYLGDEEQTRARFIANPLIEGGRLYRTGDRARLLADGTIEFLGRFDRQVQVRGYRVELAEIETQLIQFPNTNNAAVVAIDDADGTAELVAFVEPEMGATISTEHLRKHLSSRLPAYMVPARFAEVARLPVDANGKVDHRALLSLETTDVAQSAGGDQPRDETEAKLAGIWSRVLKRERVGVRDDFFELGGHSLLAMQLVKEIQAAFGTTIPLAALLASPTIEELAPRLSPRGQEAEGGKREEGGPASRPAAEAAESLPSRAEPRESPADALPTDPSEPLILEPAASHSPPALRSPSAPGALRGSGPGVPLFNIPGVFGYGLLPTPVIAHIHRDRPYYDGLQLPGADGREEPLKSVEEIADHLVKQIREVRPEGPYAITGYCYGGLLAYEVANRLLGAGEVVQALVIWHAFPWHTWRMRSLGERLRDLPSQFKAMPMQDRYYFIKSRVAGPMRNLACRVGLKQPPPPPEKDESPILAANNLANDNHRVKRPYHGRMFVARATVNPPELESPPLGGWENFARGPFKIHDLPCEHLEMIKQPWLNEVSRLTAQWLRFADREPVIRPTGGIRADEMRKAFPRPLDEPPPQPPRPTAPADETGTPEAWDAPRKRHLTLRRTP